MTRDPILYLDDMPAHARQAHHFVAGMTLDAFTEDTRSQYAVKYALHVVGEAAAKVPPTVRQRFSQVPWQQIIGMRNRLAHDYLGTRLDIVFATARDFAPLLIVQIEPDHRATRSRSWTLKYSEPTSTRLAICDGPCRPVGRPMDACRGRRVDGSADWAALIGAASVRGGNGGSRSRHHSQPLRLNRT